MKLFNINHPHTFPALTPQKVIAQFRTLIKSALCTKISRVTNRSQQKTEKVNEKIPSTTTAKLTLIPTEINNCAFLGSAQTKN